ncbi:hypothetical protein [Streptomyces sp. NPDC002851]
MASATAVTPAAADAAVPGTAVTPAAADAAVPATPVTPGTDALDTDPAVPVPVTLPLEAARHASPVDPPVAVPHVYGEVPLVLTRGPGAPRFSEDSLLPERTIPQIPLNTSVPHTVVDAPVTNPLSEKRVAGVDLDTSKAPVRATSPGMAVDAPLTRPGAGPLMLPKAKLPDAAMLTPMLRANPKADAGLI